MPLHSIADLSALTGISRETVSKKLRELPYELGARNSKLYDSVKALPVLYNVQGDGEDLNVARARLAIKQVEKIDFDMDIKSGGFVQSSVMLDETNRVCTAFRTRLSSTPTKVAPKVAEMDDPIDIEELLEEHINEALEEFSDLRTFIERFTRSPTLVRGGRK
jgi:hypothetical protein